MLHHIQTNVRLCVIRCPCESLSLTRSQCHAPNCSGICFTRISLKQPEQTHRHSSRTHAMTPSSNHTHVQVQYTVIEPKAQKRYRTFATHPWIIRRIEDGQRMMLGQRMVSCEERLFVCRLLARVSLVCFSSGGSCVRGGCTMICSSENLSLHVLSSMSVNSSRSTVLLSAARSDARQLTPLRALSLLTSGGLWHAWRGSQGSDHRPSCSALEREWP